MYKFIKKIVILLLIFLIYLFFIPCMSKAYRTSFDDIIASGQPNEGNIVHHTLVGPPVSRFDVSDRNDLYCINHSKGPGDIDLTVTRHVRIEGNRAFTQDGKETNDTINGRLAWILSDKGGFGGWHGDNRPYNPDDVRNGGYSPTQRALYAVINEWIRVNSSLGINVLQDPENLNYVKDRWDNNYVEGLIEGGKVYANNLGFQKEGNNQVIDYTKNELLERHEYVWNGVSYIRIGPFKYSFTGGHMKDISIKDQNGRLVNMYESNGDRNLWYGVFRKGVRDQDEEWIFPSQINSGENFYITVRTDSGINNITEVRGNVEIAKDPVLGAQYGVYNADLWFLTNGTTQNLLLVKVDKSNQLDYKFKFKYDIPMLGNIGIQKVDKNNSDRKLKDVEFKVKNDANGKYLKKQGDRIIYTDEKGAEIFKTDVDGKILIKDISLGTYSFIEIKNPIYGYEVTKEPIKVKANTSINYTTVTNEQKLVKISGYVWEDIQKGKDSKRDNLYTTDEYKDGNGNVHKDRRLENIRVILRLKYNNLNMIKKETRTDKNGEYVFEDVEINLLPLYSVEFEYDGLIYENVLCNLENENGSKAYEGDFRSQFNGKFAKIENAKGLQYINSVQIEKLEAKKSNLQQQLNEVENMLYNGMIEMWVAKSKIRQLNMEIYNLEQEISGLKGNKEEKNSRDTISVKDSNGNEHFKIKYNLDSDKYQASIDEQKYLVNQGNDNLVCNIFSNTENSKYQLKFEKGKGITEIKNINLGIFRRRQVDLALMQDLEQVEVGIKGYNHIYKYASRFNNGEPSPDAWDLGIKFVKKYGDKSYLRPVYNSDLNYVDESNPKNNFRMSLTYKIGLRNEEDKIYTKVNSISNYFDKEYILKAVGTRINDKGEIVDKISNDLNVKKYNDKYNLVEINTSNIIVSPRTTKYLYIQFDLPKNEIVKMLNDSANYLNNISEISSYTSYLDENQEQLYAAIDKDSVVSNIIPGDDSTYEDDTDAAPGFGVTLATNRTIVGMVFEDKANQTMLKNENIRQGNGKFDNEESKIVGVNVKLMEVIDDKNGKEILKETGLFAKTDNDGKYRISGFLPGKYVIQYTWGDGIYKILKNQKVEYKDVVENYKATVYDFERYKKEKDNPSSFYTNLGKVEEQYSRALDDWEQRLKIDKQQNSHDGGEDNGFNYATNVKDRKINSLSPKMDFGVEITDGDLGNVTLNNNKIEFLSENINLGLIERAKQMIDFKKKIVSVELKLPDGQTIVDCEIDENGKLLGQSSYVTYNKKVDGNGVRDIGLVKIEMDRELMQSSKLKVKYEYIIENNSENDYIAQGFYNHGKEYYENADVQKQYGKNVLQKKENDLVTISPSKIVDYLDSNSLIVENDDNNKNWIITSIDKLKKDKVVNDDVSKEFGWKNKVNIFMTTILNEKKLKPGENTSIYLVSGKVLTSSSNMNFVNQAEIVEIKKKFGSKITTIPGNHVPYKKVSNNQYERNENENEPDTAISEKFIITPNTGENRNYTLLITTSIFVLLIFGIGIYLIKKKVIK